MNETLTSLKQYLAIAYYRLSKEDIRLGESESIENQRSIIRNYCEQNHIFIAHEFIDDGCSGLNTDRAGFMQALQALETGQFNMFITKDLSRLSRNHIEADKFIEEYFPQKGIRYVAVDDGVDTLKEYDIIIPFKNLFNEMSSRDTSKKVTNAIRVKRERGEYYASAPYGYIKDPDDNMHLIPDPRCDWVVTKIFDLYKQGVGVTDIVWQLEEDGIPSPLKMRGWKNPHDSRKNKSVHFQTPDDAPDWKKSTIYSILQNEVYLGHTVLGKTKRKDFKKKISCKRPKSEWHIAYNTHEALVSQETFDACLKRKYAQRPKSNGAYKNIFSGYVFCDTCGARLVTNSLNLSCGTYQRFGNKACQRHGIRYSDLVEIVRNRLNFYLTMGRDERIQLVEKIRRERGETNRNEEIQSKIDELNDQNEKTNLAISTAIENSVSGLLNQKTLEALLIKYNNEIKIRDSQIFELKNQLETNLDTQAFNDFVDNLPYDHPITTLTRRDVETFIDRIEISHFDVDNYKNQKELRVKGQKQVVKIKYKFFPRSL